MLKKLTIGCLGLLICAKSALALNEPHKVKVVEITQTPAYSFIKVEEDGKQFWAAIQASKVKVGDEITIHEQVWMKNFKSKTLNKTFDKIMFAEVPKKGIQGVDHIHNIHGNMIKKKQEKAAKAAEKPDVKFNEGLYTSDEQAIKADISDLYNNKAKYKNKNVEIQGDVIQVSNKVMGNTWVKIYNGKDAVIFRSPNEDEKLSIGDIVKVVGTINTDVDFGHGYKYEILGVNGKFQILESKQEKK